MIEILRQSAAVQADSTTHDRETKKLLLKRKQKHISRRQTEAQLGDTCNKLISRLYLFTTTNGFSKVFYGPPFSYSPYRYLLVITLIVQLPLSTTVVPTVLLLSAVIG